MLTFSAAVFVLGGARFEIATRLGLGGWTSQGWFDVYLRHRVLYCNGWCSFCLTARLGFGRMDFPEGWCGVRLRYRALCCDGWSRLLMNNSAWDWEVGVRRDGLTYTYKVGCFGAMGGAGYRLTTRLGFRRLDFRGMVWSMLTVSDAAL